MSQSYTANRKTGPTIARARSVLHPHRLGKIGASSKFLRKNRECRLGGIFGGILTASPSGRQPLPPTFLPIRWECHQPPCVSTRFSVQSITGREGVPTVEAEQSRALRGNTWGNALRDLTERRRRIGSQRFSRGYFRLTWPSISVASSAKARASCWLPICLCIEARLL